MSDGDLVEDDEDNCDHVPNPIMDGTQRDFDEDGLGDACDDDVCGGGDDDCG